MATVTKLKAAVNNKNLPILGEDGNIYNYYVGRYMNKMSELGYDLTTTEIQAVNTLINTGINDGWINKVVYLLPFIGSETTPLTGIVPLIDNVADYELAEESVNSELFSYSNGKIVCMGGRSDNGNISANIPVNTSQLGFTNCFSPFVNATLDAETIQNGIKGVYTFANDTNGVSRFTCRKGQASNNNFVYGIRVYPEDSTVFRNIEDSSFDEAFNVGIFQARYYNDDLADNKIKRYIIVRGESTSRGSDMTGETHSSTYLPNSSSCRISVGSNSATPLILKVNLMAFMNPSTLTANDMYSFNQAVFALTTALGRDIPTT